MQIEMLPNIFQFQLTVTKNMYILLCFKVHTSIDILNIHFKQGVSTHYLRHRYRNNRMRNKNF